MVAHVEIIFVLMDCITFLKHSILDCEFGPGLPQLLTLILLFVFALKFLYSDRSLARLLSRMNPGFESPDVLRLRELIRAEKRRSGLLAAEIAKERDASASATDEAMAMILRLQNEKSSIELEWMQYKRIAEEKQRHDEEVIRSLQWLVSRRGETDGSFRGNILEDFENAIHSL